MISSGTELMSAGGLYPATGFAGRFGLSVRRRESRDGMEEELNMPGERVDDFMGERLGVRAWGEAPLRFERAEERVEP